jgi:hypothetical protein
MGATALGASPFPYHRRSHQLYIKQIKRVEATNQVE